MSSKVDFNLIRRLLNTIGSFHLLKIKRDRRAFARKISLTWFIPIITRLAIPSTERPRRVSNNRREEEKKKEKERGGKKANQRTLRSGISPVIGEVKGRLPASRGLIIHPIKNLHINRARRRRFDRRDLMESFQLKCNIVATVKH